MKEFLAFIENCVGHRQHDVLRVYLSPTVSIPINKASITFENTMRLRKYLLEIVGTDNGTDVISLATADEMPMGNLTARTVIAAGRAFGLWNIVPMDVPNAVLRTAIFDGMPSSIMTTPVDRFDPTYDGSIKYNTVERVAA